MTESANIHNRNDVPTRRKSRTLNPLARKRWLRFRRHRRGFWSLCLLVILYTVSLFSEFICNDRPLYVQFEGRHYFPVFTFYPEDVFTGSGRQTRPDYKAIRASERWQRDPSNVMVFPPIPHSPNGIIKPETLRGKEQVTMTVRPVPRVGSVNIDSQYRVVRSQSAEPFLDGLAEGESLTSLWLLDAGAMEAIHRRLDNVSTPSYRTIVTHALDRERMAEVSMPEFSTRKTAPRDVRVTFREDTGTAASERKYVFSRNVPGKQPDDAWWKTLPHALRESLMAMVDRRFSEPVSGTSISIDGHDYAVQLVLNDVQWPFRPVPGHWLGIDNAGRDVLARILYGLRTSMTFGLLLVMFSMGFGIIMGAIQGYYGGRIDLFAQRAIEIWSTIPFLYVMILLGSMYGRSFSLLLFCYAIFNWIGISYYVRAEFLRLRHAPFVDAARCLGLSSSRIMFRHILPNALTPIITFFPFSLVGAIGSLAVLDFLGFGLPPPTPSWGEMLQQAQSFRWAWWLILYPSLALFVVMLLGVFMGEGVRDAYDPKPVMKME